MASPAAGVWTALIAMLVLKYLQLKLKFAWSLSTLAAFAGGEKESLAETFPRFTGITPRELRLRLQRRTAGEPAE